MSFGFRSVGVFLLFVLLLMPSFYYRIEVKELNFEREQQIRYVQGALDFYYERSLHNEKINAFGLFVWAGQMAQEIQALKIPIESHMSALYAFVDFYFGWILN